jgi:FlaA1/EpsC-like NDP-sugar epimerase
VTHPEVRRYFMTTDEAVQLVLQAAVIGRDGEVLVLDMGEPVLIADIAHRLVAGSGRDISIVYTGLRPGEKLTESTLGANEPDLRPFHPLIRHVPAVAADLDPHAPPEEVRAALAQAALHNLQQPLVAAGSSLC